MRTNTPMEYAIYGNMTRGSPNLRSSNREQGCEAMRTRARGDANKGTLHMLCTRCITSTAGRP